VLLFLEKHGRTDLKDKIQQSGGLLIAG